MLRFPYRPLEMSVRFFALLSFLQTSSHKGAIQFNFHYRPEHIVNWGKWTPEYRDSHQDTDFFKQNKAKQTQSVTKVGRGGLFWAFFAELLRKLFPATITVESDSDFPLDHSCPSTCFDRLVNTTLFCRIAGTFQGFWDRIFIRKWRWSALNCQGKPDILLKIRLSACAWEKTGERISSLGDVDV